MSRQCQERRYLHPPLPLSIMFQSTFVQKAHHSSLGCHSPSTRPCEEKKELFPRALTEDVLCYSVCKMFLKICSTERKEQHFLCMPSYCNKGRWLKKDPNTVDSKQTWRVSGRHMLVLRNGILVRSHSSL